MLEHALVVAAALASAVFIAIGIVVRNPTAVEMANGMRGIVITRVKPESKLKGKLIAGDIIHAINGMRVTTAQDFLARLAASASVQNTELTLQRGQTIIRLTISPVRME